MLASDISEKAETGERDDIGEVGKDVSCEAELLEGEGR